MCCDRLNFDITEWGPQPLVIEATQSDEDRLITALREAEARGMSAEEALKILGEAQEKADAR